MKYFKYFFLYFLGFLFSFLMYFNLIQNMSKRCHRKTTYRDVAFCVVISSLSWISVGAAIIIYITENEFWDKEID